MNIGDLKLRNNSCLKLKSAKQVIIKQKTKASGDLGYIYPKVTNMKSIIGYRIDCLKLGKMGTTAVKAI